MARAETAAPCPPRARTQGRAWGEQRRYPQQVAQRAVGQLGHAERAEQAVLAQPQIQAGARSGI